MPYGPTVLETLQTFHALTGSDVTSFRSGHSKKTAWKVFEQHHELLKDLGKGNLAKETIAETEKFVCRLYNTQDVTRVNKARSQLFMKSRAPESFPPTSDALSFHIKQSPIRQQCGDRHMRIILTYHLPRIWAGKRKMGRYCQY